MQTQDVRVANVPEQVGAGARSSSEEKVFHRSQTLDRRQEACGVRPRRRGERQTPVRSTASHSPDVYVWAHSLAMSMAGPNASVQHPKG
jgi:hypothetical protein